ncbi:VanZ family protein [Viridibacillus sp. YIM B01967]|uniref:VanZ family protein n=1 Tax=Viridibacillus soli TaxID=2798301 RepID=A0ABS1H5I2_9BACL|nr:VanZ family protein [Viridibacillus soli]MBK3494659.1 VanZ family protein [Viridibacillus soli]
MKKLIPLLILLLVIFISSSQSYEQQSIVPTLRSWFPNEPLKPFLSLFEIPYWGIIVSVEERGYYYFLEFLIRKAAHFGMFGLIAITVFIALPKHKFRLFTAALLTFSLAALDEFHQYFTSGRTATFQDVMLDTVGAVTFLILFKCILLLIRKNPAKA